MTADELPDGAHWRRQASVPGGSRAVARALAELKVGLVMEVGASPARGPIPLRAWMDVDARRDRAADAPGADAPGADALGADGLGADGLAADALGADARPGGDFAASVARAYQAGLPISFAGLFAGETRCRISLPGYPFQRKRHWFASATARAPAS